jgi:hypothetical protein
MLSRDSSELDRQCVAVAALFTAGPLIWVGPIRPDHAQPATAVTNIGVWTT